MRIVLVVPANVAVRLCGENDHADMGIAERAPTGLTAILPAVIVFFTSRAAAAK